jgi:Flp pilus assembly secretin CpaC
VPIIGPGGIPVNVALPRDIVQLKAAGGEIEVRTLMRPHLMTLSGEEHEIVAGLNVPVPTAAAESAGGGGASDPLSTRVSIERQDVGLRLRVKPVAGQAGDVLLAIDLDVTNLFPSLAGGRADIGPTIERRTLRAHTRVDDGGVAVLAMLLEKNQNSFETGAPYLKDVPVVGNLLRQTLDGHGTRHLVIAVQASIARSADERLADTIRLRTAHERALARGGALQGEGWALRVATRTTGADAETLAEKLGEIAGKRARVVAWEWAGARRYDVVLSGFAGVGAAADAIPALEAGGWHAELVALPGK